MKKYILLLTAFIPLYPLFSQLTITSEALWTNNGNVTVTLNNTDLINNGTFTAGTSNMRFTGNQNSIISGSTMPIISILEIGKTNNAKVLLSRNISVGTSINFTSGLLDLNGNNILLGTSANLAGESENARIVGTSGFVEITQNMNAPFLTNAGNLGASITSNTDLGQVTIRRGHAAHNGAGLMNSIHRFYTISPVNNDNLNATLRLKYFDAELNGQNENLLVMYQGSSAAGPWTNLSQSTRNTNANYVEKTGIGSFALQTLANDNVQQANGVTGLVFSGQRKKATEVTLKWTSQTETNMSGFQIQRRLKNEIDFSDRLFVNSIAPGGNSFSQLSYQNVDANSYTDTSYYRLKIVTPGNTFTYSNIIAVAAKTSGGGGNGGGGNGGGNPNNNTIAASSTMADAKSNTASAKITVGPNPNYGNFWFSVSGLIKETKAALYTIDGKLIKQFLVVNMQQQPVNDLSAGIYILKVPGYDATKIVVQGDGRKGTDNRLSAPKINQMD